MTNERKQLTLVRHVDWGIWAGQLLTEGVCVLLRASWPTCRGFACLMQLVTCYGER